MRLVPRPGKNFVISNEVRVGNRISCLNHDLLDFWMSLNDRHVLKRHASRKS
jgi:hypothetical protein